MRESEERATKTTAKAHCARCGHTFDCERHSDCVGPYGCFVDYGRSEPFELHAFVPESEVSA